jgi:hypothetical protein
MNPTRILLALVATLAALGTAGCGTGGNAVADPQREPGCVVPPNEDALLKVYAADPVLTFVPAGVRREGATERQQGCVRLNKEDTSVTSATTHFAFDLPRDYGRNALEAAYHPVVSVTGWAPDNVRQTALGPNAGGSFLAYCRAIDGVTSELTISANPARRIDVRASGPERPPSPQWQEEPGVIVLVIEAAPNRASCLAPTIEPYR